MKYIAEIFWFFTALSSLLIIFPAGDNSDTKSLGEFSGYLLTVFFGFFALLSTVVYWVMRLL